MRQKAALIVRPGVHHCAPLQVLAFDRIAAAAYGAIAAGRRTAGRPVATADGQIAAIARARGATLLATRDVGGFQDCGVPILDPWQA